MEALNELHDTLSKYNDLTLKELNECKWYQLLLKIRILGRLEVLLLIDTLIHNLMTKYNNENGDLN